MKTNIKATGISITPSIADYIERKISMLEKFFQGADDVLVNVEVGRTTRHHKSGDIFRAEIKIIFDGHEYYAEAETEDLYASIDEVKDEIAHEIGSKRKKMLRLIRRSGAKIKSLLRWGRSGE